MIDVALLNDVVPLLAKASINTLIIAFFSTLIGLCGGTAIALAEQSHISLLRLVAALYVTVVRGTPMIVQIVFLYYLYI